MEGQHLRHLLGEGAVAAPLLLERLARVVPPEEADGVAHLLCVVLGVASVGGWVGGLLSSGEGVGASVIRLVAVALLCSPGRAARAC